MDGPLWRWVATSHSRTVPSWPAVARVSPSGLNATSVTCSDGSGEALIGELAWRPVAASQNWNVPSSPAVARTWPDGLNVTELTRPPVAIGRPAWRQVPTLQNRTPSCPQVARVLPSGRNARVSAPAPEPPGRN